MPKLTLSIGCPFRGYCSIAYRASILSSPTGPCHRLPIRLQARPGPLPQRSNSTSSKPPRVYKCNPHQHTTQFEIPVLVNMCSTISRLASSRGPFRLLPLRASVSSIGPVMASQPTLPSYQISGNSSSCTTCMDFPSDFLQLEAGKSQMHCICSVETLHTLRALVETAWFSQPLARKFRPYENMRLWYNSPQLPSG